MMEKQYEYNTTAGQDRFGNPLDGSEVAKKVQRQVSEERVTQELNHWRSIHNPNPDTSLPLDDQIIDSIGLKKTDPNLYDPNDFVVQENIYLEEKPSPRYKINKQHLKYIANTITGKDRFGKHFNGSELIEDLLTHKAWLEACKKRIIDELNYLYSVKRNIFDVNSAKLINYLDLINETLYAIDTSDDAINNKPPMHIAPRYETLQEKYIPESLAYLYLSDGTPVHPDPYDYQTPELHFEETKKRLNALISEYQKLRSLDNTQLEVALNNPLLLVEFNAQVLNMSNFEIENIDYRLGLVRKNIINYVEFLCREKERMLNNGNSTHKDMLKVKWGENQTINIDQIANFLSSLKGQDKDGYALNLDLNLDRLRTLSSEQIIGHLNTISFILVNYLSYLGNILSTCLNRKDSTPAQKEVDRLNHWESGLIPVFNNSYYAALMDYKIYLQEISENLIKYLSSFSSK